MMIQEIKSYIADCVEETTHNKLYLGTDYGGWSFLTDIKPEPGEAVILCGVGEDISFDVELQKYWSCDIMMVDPTPRAIAHWQGLLDSLESNKEYPINHSETAFYDISRLDAGRMSLIEKAVWYCDDTLPFFVPRKSAHVSHSLNNLQSTSDHIMVDTITIENILRQKGLTNIAMLKLDIEGAEIDVVSHLLRDTPYRPKQILCEFDYIGHPTEGRLDSVKDTIGMLLKEYQCLDYDGHSNCLFVRRDLL